MSARQVIELYEALPKPERELVAEHIKSDVSQVPTKVDKKANFDAIVKRVFEKHRDLMSDLAK